MRFTQDQLTFKALCAVSEIVEQCHDAPLRPSLSVRFALAYLFSVSRSPDRKLYDSFWKIIQDPHAMAYCEGDSQYLRITKARSCLTAMVRQAGLPLTPEFFIALSDSHRRCWNDNGQDMCNHYRTDPDAIPTWAQYIGAEPFSPFSQVQVDIWPKRAAIVARQVDGKRVIETMTWGFPWQRAGKKPGSFVRENTTNVRNLGSTLWRNQIGNGMYRCLVPFNSFAEPKPGAGREEVWFKISDAPVSAFAGIWKPTDDADRGNVFAFLTCEPNPLVEPIHPKAMPVILHPEDYLKWLGGAPAAEFVAPFPSQLMEIE
ncbi:MAG: SOS response-associated peptidase family protein [Sphingorhabdus sp.]